MLLTDVSHFWALKLPPPDVEKPRSAGVHISDLVSAAAIDRGLFEPDDRTAELGAGVEAGVHAQQRQFPQHAINRMCAGLAWEDWLARQYRQIMQFHPGEVSIHGVAGSPDALSVFNNALYVHEFKFTWKSANTPTARHWYWLAQIKAYLKAVDGAGAFLHTYHVMGDYRGSGPLYRVMFLQFSPQELHDNWQELEQYRPQVERELGL
jgi:hypothetical protein